MNAHDVVREVDRAFDQLLARLDCTDGTDAWLVSHWQTDPDGFRLQVTRKTDGATLTRFVRVNGDIAP